MRKSRSLSRFRRALVLPFACLLLIAAQPLAGRSPWTALWTIPCILFASIAITWGAESAQFFVAQGFALAILAWMQTLPEFAVEAVLAWKQQTNLLLAGLTGALRLLIGLAWPLIYLTAAVVHRRRTGRALRSIHLAAHHSVEVAGLLPPLLYAVFIWHKGSLNLYDAAVLCVIYVAYLVLLTKLPPQESEAVDELETVPRHIVRSPRTVRNLSILACFAIGGITIYFTAEPFLGSMISLALALGIPSFHIIQWFAPVVSEFPELLSTFYFARQREKASVGLMNIASSNINQWTLLIALLPITFSLSRHAASAIVFTPEQQTELALTVAQSIAGWCFLLNMRFAWWEATLTFLLFAAQFALPPVWGEQSKTWITGAFLALALFEIVKSILARTKPAAWLSFVQTWREHVNN